MDAALALVMLRWPSEVRSIDQLELPSAVTSAKLERRELDMAKRLVKDMSGSWQPDEYRDTFEEKIMQLVEQKAREGKIADVEGVGEEEGRRSADIIDLTELLKRSLGGKAKEKKPAPAKSSSKKTPAKNASPATKKSATRK